MYKGLAACAALSAGCAESIPFLCGVQMLIFESLMRQNNE